MIRLELFTGVPASEGPCHRCGRRRISHMLGLGHRVRHFTIWRSRFNGDEVEALEAEEEKEVEARTVHPRAPEVPDGACGR